MFLLDEILHEMPFWFARMLTRLDEYDTWKISLEANTAKTLQPDELLLINEVFLPHGAIDRTDLCEPSTENLKHFFLEKYRPLDILKFLCYLSQ